MSPVAYSLRWSARSRIGRRSGEPFIAIQVAGQTKVTCWEFARSPRPWLVKLRPFVSGPICHLVKMKGPTDSTPRAPSPYASITTAAIPVEYLGVPSILCSVGSAHNSLCVAAVAPFEVCAVKLVCGVARAMDASVQMSMPKKAMTVAEHARVTAGISKSVISRAPIERKKVAFKPHQTDYHHRKEKTKACEFFRPVDGHRVI